jgi:uncharacterized protein (DUF1800 family)
MNTMLKPLPDDQWNFQTAAHLANRAGFGATPPEIERLVALGPEKAVAQFVDYEAIPDPFHAPAWAKPDPERLEIFQELRRLSQQMRDASDEERAALDRKRRELQQMERRMQNERMLELRGWWLERMARSPRPLEEKLTLFWHGHFATSVQKVQDAYYMWRQNELFRKHGSGDWLELLAAASKDPAMLIWLDQAQSNRNRPNENFAREVMELFALGEGNYTEQDVLEAARALTGWSLNRAKREFEFRPNMHDTGVKTVLGKTGRLRGDDVLAQIVAQPQAARFISAKLWSFFASEEPSAQLTERLAEVLRENRRQFKPLLRTMFRSEEFYSETVIRTQVKSPVQWLVGSARLLERDLPPARASATLLATLGQNLFAPPNVKGWDGGLTWITTNNLLARYNASAMLVHGEAPMFSGAARPGAARPRRRSAAGPVELAKVVPGTERTRERLVPYLERRFLQAKLKPNQAAVLNDYIKSQGELSDRVVLDAIRLIMSTPEYQLT